MDKSEDIEVQAFLWNGTIQIPGKIKLSDVTLEFVATGFEKSHLGLKIEIADINRIETYLIFDLERNGLLVRDVKEGESLFVIPDLAGFFKELKSRIASSS